MMRRLLHPEHYPPALARGEEELAVLSACLIDGTRAVTLARAVLTAEDFAWPAHGELFLAMLELADAGEPLDTVTLKAALERRGTFERVGGWQAVNAVLDAPGFTAVVESHAKLVKDAARRRRLAALADSLVTAVADPASDLAAETARVAGELVPLAQDGEAGPDDQDGFCPLGDTLWRVLEQVEERHRAAQVGRTLGVTTGYPELDEHFHGFRPGELIIVGAAPKHGKSTLGFNVLRHVIETDHAAVVSAEMTRDEITEGLIALESGIPRQRLASGQLRDDDWPKLARAGGVLKPRLARLHVDDVAFPSLEQVVTRCLRLKAEHPAVAFLVVDYLQLVTNPMKGRRGDEEINAVCVALKGLAKRLAIPVLAPCQVNYKDTDRRENKRPTIADLQGASGMAQAANHVLLLYRPAMHKQVADDVLEVEVALSRRTDRAAVELVWDGARMRITSRRHGAPGSTGPTLVGSAA